VVVLTLLHRCCCVVEVHPLVLLVLVQVGLESALDIVFGNGPDPVLILVLGLVVVLILVSALSMALSTALSTALSMALCGVWRVAQIVDFSMAL
jgi:hypothetical protein